MCIHTCLCVYISINRYKHAYIKYKWYIHTYLIYKYKNSQNMKYKQKYLIKYCLYKLVQKTPCAQVPTLTYLNLLWKDIYSDVTRCTDATSQTRCGLRLLWPPCFVFVSFWVVQKTSALGRSQNMTSVIKPLSVNYIYIFLYFNTSDTSCIITLHKSLRAIVLSFFCNNLRLVLYICCAK